ncbi:MAG TPA: MFS transporter [Actinomycetota bacterium]|jgi:MFS family permease
MEITTGHARAILRDPDTRRLLIAQYLGQTADGFAQAVFAFVIVLEPLAEGTPKKILQLFALTLIPYSFLSPFLGVLVDRWSRRAVMIWTNVARAVILISLPGWAHLFPGDFGLYASLLALLALGRLFLTAKGAALPLVLHERYLLQGNAISGGGGMVSALLGGMLGVAAVRLLTSNQLFAVAGCLYGLTLLFTTRLSWPLITHTERLGRVRDAFGKVVRGLGEGVRAVWSRPHARLPLLGIFVVRAIGMVVAIAAIIVIGDVLSDKVDRADASALALGAAGVGAFVAALTAPFVGRRFDKPQMILLGFVVSGAGIIAFGGIFSVVAVMALTFVGGYGTFLTKVSVDAQVQEALPDEFRGRAFALYDILYNLASVAAGVVMVVLGDDPGRRQIMTLGVLALAVAAALARAMSRAGMLTESGSPVTDSARSGQA